MLFLVFLEKSSRIDDVAKYRDIAVLRYFVAVYYRRNFFDTAHRYLQPRWHMSMRTGRARVNESFYRRRHSHERSAVVEQGCCLAAISAVKNAKHEVNGCCLRHMWNTSKFACMTDDADRKYKLMSPKQGDHTIHNISYKDE